MTAACHRFRRSDACDPTVRQVVELDHAKLDYLILPLVEAGRFHIEQDGGLCALTNGGSESRSRR
jgi:hypothetical protein